MPMNSKNINRKLFHTFLLILLCKQISCTTPTYTESEYIAQIGAFPDALTGEYFTMSTQAAGNQFSALYDDDPIGTYISTDVISAETNQPK